MRLSGCKECPLEQDGRGRILERASADSKQRAHKRWTEMSIIVHYPNISKLSNSTYMTWHMNTYDTYHIGNIIYTSRSYYDHNVINYIWSLSISRYTFRRSFTTSPPWLWRFTESRLWKSLGATTPNIRLELPNHHEEALPHRAWPNIQNSPEGLLASLNIVVIFKYLQDALRLQDFHTRDVKRAGGI